MPPQERGRYFKTHGPNWFFDRQAVIARVGVARVRVLSRMGAFVRTRARSLIRQKKGVSAPGTPPHSHEGSLRKMLYFAYDPATDTVVVGPAWFNWTKKRLRAGNKPVPQLLEEGGRHVVVDRSGGRRVLTYRPRPYMSRALALEKPNFPKLFRGEVSS